MLLMKPPVTSGYVVGKLHRYLAQFVQDIVDGKQSKRSSISVPPQHGKSRLLTVLAGAWLMGRFPGMALAVTGALGDLLKDLSKEIRALVQTQRYQWVFKDVLPLYGSNRSDAWTLTNGSSIIARPAGAKLTGRRVDFLIIDDPHKGREQAESVVERHKIQEWYHADCYTRLAPNAKVLIVATRWHPEDLIGHLTSEEREEELKLLGEESELFNRVIIEARCENPDSDPIKRELGEPLCPELGRGERFLAATQASIPHYEWSSQYQGNPTPRQGDVADVTKLKYCRWSDVPDSVTWTRGWDLALTEKQASDYTAGALVGVDTAQDKKERNFYIGGMFHDKKAWPRLKPAIVELSLKDKEDERLQIARIGVEIVGGFVIGKHELSAALAGEVRVAGIISSKSKLVRAQPWLNRLDIGKVIIVTDDDPKKCVWIKRLKDEMTAFPTGANDDQIDGISVGWTQLTKPTLLMA
jgi:predicted phage terminase large subunit-like protein